MPKAGSENVIAIRCSNGVQVKNCTPLLYLIGDKKMTVKELIRHLQTFDENHHVEIEVDAECGHLKVISEVEDVQFKHGDCILYGYSG